MKAIKSLVMASALAAAGVALAVDARAAGTWHGGTHGAATGHWNGGGGHWNGGGGHWNGGGGHWRGGGWRGGRWYGGSYWYFGAPLLWSAWYWGWPYDYYYPRTVVYDRVIERYPADYPDGVMEPAPYEVAPSTQVAPSRGAPSQGPLYMNYCESARAYYPKVTSCPEGWKFISPSR